MWLSRVWRSRTSGALYLVATAILCAARSAGAEPTLSLDVAGHCPSVEQLRAALAGVITVTDCSLASMAPETFRNLLLDHPEIGVHVIERLAEIVQRCDQRIMDLSMLSAVQRVHVEILRLARPADAKAETWMIRSMPTHTEIASRASTVRETVARAMKVLTVAGIAQRKGKTLFIEDYERLAEMVESGSGQMIAAR